MHSLYYHNSIELARYANGNDLLFDVFYAEKSDDEATLIKCCDLIRIFTLKFAKARVLIAAVFKSFRENFLGLCALQCCCHRRFDILSALNGKDAKADSQLLFKISNRSVESFIKSNLWFPIKLGFCQRYIRTTPGGIVGWQRVVNNF